MRRFFNVKTLFILLVGFSLFESCTVDDNPIPPTPTDIPPSISLLADVGFLSTDATISAADSVKVKVDCLKGDNQMGTLLVQRDGVDMDLAEISFDGVAAAANPALLFGDDKDAFTREIAIANHGTGDALYTFIVTGDGDGTENSVSITVTVEDAEPTVSLSGSGMYIAAADMLAGFDITVETNGVDIASIEVQEEGVAIADAGRIYLGGITAANQFMANPNTDIPVDYVSGIAGADMFIIAQSTTATTVNYSVIVTNTAGKSASADFTITTSGTDIDAEHTGVLLENADGPNATGGMKLIDGTTVSVNSSEADIIDQGNDNGVWLQQIGTANGSSMKALSQAQVDAGFNYGTVLYREQILDAWNGGNTLATGISGTVAVGDVYIVNVGVDYFIIQCALIEATDNNNLDKYEFNIKVADYQ